MAYAFPKTGIAAGSAAIIASQMVVAVTVLAAGFDRRAADRAELDADRGAGAAGAGDVGDIAEGVRRAGEAASRLYNQRNCAIIEKESRQSRHQAHPLWRRTCVWLADPYTARIR